MRKSTMTNNIYILRTSRTCPTDTLPRPIPVPRSHTELRLFVNHLSTWDLPKQRGHSKKWSKNISKVSVTAEQRKAETGVIWRYGGRLLHKVMSHFLRSVVSQIIKWEYNSFVRLRYESKSTGKMFFKKRQWHSWWLLSQHLVVKFFFQISVLTKHNHDRYYQMASPYHIKPGKCASSDKTPIFGTSGKDSANMNQPTALLDTVLFAT